MNITQEQRQLLSEMQGLTLAASEQTPLNVSLNVGSCTGQGIIWSELLILCQGEQVHRSSIGIQGGEEFDCFGVMTLAKQRDLIAELIVKHRRQAA